VQFPHNKPIYIPQHIKIPNHSGSFLEWILLQTERVHAQVRRYQSPDEYPFFPNQLPKPFLAPLSYPKILYANSVNYNQELMQAYVNHILPAACCVRPGIPDDRGETKENYGSAAVLDVACLQALSRRIHFGKFVAEAKFRQQQEAFSDMIRRKDIDGLTAAITKPEVEQQVLKRLELKARTYGTDPATKNKDAKNEGGTVSEKPQPKINVGAVVAMYKVRMLFYFIYLSSPLFPYLLNFLYTYFYSKNAGLGDSIDKKG
jgi:chorismate mutase